MTLSITTFAITIKSSPECCQFFGPLSKDSKRIPMGEKLPNLVTLAE